MFPVGTFARLAGVSAKALRAYDAIGVFRPAWVDPITGYRHYSAAQLPELRRVLALRDLGLSRVEMRDLVRGNTDLSEALHRRRRELDEERREVERRLAALEIELAAPVAGDIVVRRLGRELVATLDLADVQSDDIGEAFRELETHVRDRSNRASSPPGAIPAEHLIYVPIRRRDGAAGRIGIRELPPTRATTLLHRGPYASLPAAMAKLGAWLAAAGVERTGLLRVLYLQFGAEVDLRLPRGWTVDSDEDFVTELQQPIG